MGKSERLPQPISQSLEGLGQLAAGVREEAHHTVLSVLQEPSQSFHILQLYSQTTREWRQLMERPSPLELGPACFFMKLTMPSAEPHVREARLARDAAPHLHSAGPRSLH